MRAALLHTARPAAALLHGALMHGALLRRALLHGALLRGARLVPALLGATLLSATMLGASLSGAILVGSPSAAFALPTYSATAPRGRTVCTVTDHRIIGLSGLIVTHTGFISISDSNIDKRAIRVWYLDRRCRPVRSVSYPTSAYDPEDAAIGRDGTVYVADIGDNERQRASIAVWRIPPGSSTPHIYRYRYPDHPHDAEAILLAADDSPIFVTKDLGLGDIFVPTARPDPSGKPVLLKQVGAFQPRATGTPNGLGVFGAMLVTGGANSSDRTTVALRTYADAYVWRVPDGNVVKAITTGSPQVVPLPDEPQGESIAFDRAGTHLYTVSDREVRPVRTPILMYGLPPGLTGSGSTAPSANTASGSTAATNRSAAAGAAGAVAGASRRPVRLGVFASVAGLGAVLVAAGFAGLLRARRRRRAAGQ